MKKYALIASLLLLLLLPAATACGEALIVYGENYYFHVSEPPGWQGYTADANKYRLNIYFCLPGYQLNDSPSIMYIRVLKKAGASVEQSLAADMNNFSRRKKSVTFSDLEIQETSYRYAAKQYLIDNKTCDFLCYIDPGQDCPYYVIIVLSGPLDVSPAYLDAFQALIGSFQWGGEAIPQN